MSCIRVGLFILLLNGSPWLSSWACAEAYIAGHIGIALPDNLADVNSTSLNAVGVMPGARISDLNLQNALLYGAKLGYFTAARPWLGVEIEVYSATPHIQQQTVITAVPGNSTGATLPGSHLRVTTFAFNVMTRDTAIGAFQPYGGIGPGLFVTQSSGGALTGGTRSSLGLNLQAGGRYFLSKRFALFGEFKYNKADLKAGGLRGDYSAQIFTGGISFHFY